jgi:hypothetical protein
MKGSMACRYVSSMLDAAEAVHPTARINSKRIFVFMAIE